MVLFTTNITMKWRREVLHLELVILLTFGCNSKYNKLNIKIFLGPPCTIKNDLISKLRLFIYMILWLNKQTKHLIHSLEHDQGKTMTCCFIIHLLLWFEKIFMVSNPPPLIIILFNSEFSYKINSHCSFWCK